ncbi:hypothetical protein HPP92_021775 [Vanilla planifolia]|uniref:HSF-type DNA-binding domain-containing protein n=1 Tax=Vanilla planifolia TaxID=51239 RepID=A0A835Q2P3_VANPL|nr:hypothetical protein HPP92_021775 [Vanilla planifolia]
MRTFGETGIIGVDGGRAVAAAPFVLKTYRMVDDPSTDLVIAWGRENNSFVVVDPFAFSRTLLPAHFKHSNFSSFVRQLNTYGFRKVDPDRWEFAHSSFMRGKTHLLGQVVRRNGCVVGGRKRREEEEMDEAVAAEVARLKQEQSAIEDRVEKMWRRLQETERRPRQMLAFLLRVVGDPEMLKRLMARAGVEEGGKKRARLCIADRRFGEGEKAAATAAAVAVASVAVDGTCCRGEGFMPAIDVAATETAVAEGGVDLGVGGALGSAIGDGMGGVFGSYLNKREIHSVFSIYLRKQRAKTSSRSVLMADQHRAGQKQQQLRILPFFFPIIIHDAVFAAPNPKTLRSDLSSPAKQKNVWRTQARGKWAGRAQELLV